MTQGGAGKPLLGGALHEQFLSAITTVDYYMWRPWTLVFIAFVSVFLTVRSGFFQVTHFGYLFRSSFGQLFDRSGDPNRERMTPFQATSTSLAGTVGMGNMAGVATALTIGGPGAIFWMWVLAFFGMITKAVEITIAVHYRDIDAKDQAQGGPMYYIRRALGWKSLAVLFSVGIAFNSFFSSSMLQAHTVGQAFKASYGVNPYITTAAMAVVTAIVAIGGVRRIGRVCERLVPGMGLMYLVGGLIIVVANVDELPGVLSRIVTYAFAPAPAAGGFAGAAVLAAIQNGMARGMLSNEAGLGTAPMVHANAETDHPFRQGMWGAAEVFIDTTIMCSITAFIILSTGMLENGETGIVLLMAAFSSFYSPEAAGAFVSLAILTFCLSTQIGFYIYFQTALVDLFGERAFYYLRWFYFLPGIAFASIERTEELWAVANISVFLSAVPNLIALVMLSSVFLILMRDYLSGERRYATAIIDQSRAWIRTAPNHEPTKEPA